MVVTDSLPEELLSPGAGEMGFILAGDNSQPVGFGYEISELNYKIVAKFGKEFDDFNGTDLKSYYRNDTLFLTASVKYKDIEMQYYYQWDSKKLTLLEKKTITPGAQAKTDGDNALRNGEIRLAAEHYNKIKHVPPATISQMAFRLLAVAHHFAMEDMAGGHFKEAADKMNGAFVFSLNKSMIESEDEFAYHKITMDNFEQKQIDSLGSWLTHYSYIMCKADSMEKALKIINLVNASYPQFADAFLVKADILFDMKREEDAKPYYDKYIALMTTQGKQSYIQPRANERK